jgi:hypothetical protein
MRSTMMAALLLATPFAGLAGEDDDKSEQSPLEPLVAQLRERIKAAVARGVVPDALVHFNGDKTKAKILRTEADRIHVRIFKFNNVEAALPWTSLDYSATARCAKSCLAPGDMEGTLTVMALLRRLGSDEEAKELLTGLRRSKDAEVVRRAEQAWADAEPPDFSSDKATSTSDPPPADPTPPKPGVVPSKPSNPTKPPDTPDTPGLSNPTNLPSPTNREIVIFDVDRVVTKKERGFPRIIPPWPQANGDWTKPVDFAHGTLYLRVEIRKMPSKKSMIIKFLAYQDKTTREQGSRRRLIDGPAPGGAPVVVEWIQAVDKMWMTNSNMPIDWSKQRSMMQITFMRPDGKPVSDYMGWKWNGENPDEWYPMDVRFTAVVVAKGQTFSGWARYTGANRPPAPGGK